MAQKVIHVSKAYLAQSLGAAQMAVDAETAVERCLTGPNIIAALGADESGTPDGSDKTGNDVHGEKPGDR